MRKSAKTIPLILNRQIDYISRWYSTTELTPETDFWASESRKDFKTTAEKNDFNCK